MMVPLALLAEARRLLGEANVYSETADLAGYDVDGRGRMGRGAAVLRPASTEEVSALVRLAWAAGVRLVPQGARTGLVAGGLGDDSGASCLLSLERLRRSPSIDAVNRTAAVDAGVRLSTLNDAAGAFGLFFPIDLGADPSVGGMVSANTGGARFLRYGDVRRNLLSLQVVLNDEHGTVLELGGDLWKDNSGLDLKQIFVGASGSLGVVTRATLALQPKPATIVTAMVALREADYALALLTGLEARFGTLLSAFEGMAGAAIDLALAHVPGLRSPFLDGTPDYAVLIEISGAPFLAADLLMEELGEALADDRVKDHVVDVAIDRDGGLWKIRHAIPEGLRAAGVVVAHDIALRRGDVMRFRTDLRTRIAARFPGFLLADFGHIGDGGLHFNLVWRAFEGPPGDEELAALRDMIFTAVVEKYGGSFSAEHGIGPANAAFYRRFTAAGVRQLAGAIQRIAAPAPIGRVDFSGSQEPV